MSENNTQLCRFCNTTKTLDYFCETCGSYCCSDCILEKNLMYFICDKCDSRNIGITNEGNVRICNDCGSTTPRRAYETAQYCPKCNEDSIVNIYEKKDVLEGKFLQMIRNIRSFAEPFVDLKNRLESFRENLKKFRELPIPCFHYPKLEQELIIVFKMFNEVVNTLLDKINIYLHHFSLNQDYFFDIYDQPNTSITVIERILQNLTKSNESIQEYIDKNIVLIEDMIKKIPEKLMFIENIKEMFLKYKRHLQLSQNEKPIIAIRAIYSNEYQPQGAILKTRGILFITTYDLLFIHLHGRKKKKKKLLIKTPIIDLKSMQIKRRKRRMYRKRLILEFDYNITYDFYLPSNTHTKIFEYINLAKVFDQVTKNNPDTERKLNAINLDLNNLINFIEEAINSFYSLKCRYNQKTTNSLTQESDNGVRSYTQTCNEQSNNLQFGNIQNQHQNLYTPFPIFPTSGPTQNSQSYCNNIQDNHNNYPRRPQSPNYNPNLDRDDRNNLFRRVGRYQVNIPQYNYPVGSYNTEWFHKAGLNRNTTIEDVPFIDPTYENYNKYHLSDYFVPNPRYTRESKKMRELKKEQYGLNMTLKNLEEKLERCVISEEDYFKFYKDIQKRLKEIDEDLNILKDDVY